MICPNCDTGILTEGHATLPATVKGVELSVFMSALICSHCHYKTVHGSQMADFMRRGADEYRKLQGLLTSVQIVTARKAIGMTQEKFADYLGVGIASVKRWEWGQVQDPAMDKLIRLMTDVSTAQENLLQLSEARSVQRQSYSSGNKQWKRGGSHPTIVFADQVA